MKERKIPQLTENYGTEHWRHQVLNGMPCPCDTMFFFF